jgi:hypothetical protein
MKQNQVSKGTMTTIGKYGFIVNTFDAEKTIYDDNDNIEGYNGIHKTTLFLFDTPKERDEALEDIQVSYGESDNGSTQKTVWVGFLGDIEGLRQ